MPRSIRPAFAWNTFLIGCLALGALCSPASEPIRPGSEGPLLIPDRLPSVLYVPTDYLPGKPLPLILNLHGQGGTPTTWPFLDATGGKGYLIAGLAYGGFKDGGANGIKADRESCKAMIDYIDQVRGQIAASYALDQRHVILAGISMGGWGVNSYGFQKESKGRYRGYAILAAGAVNRGNDLSVTNGIPVFIMNGEKDPNLAAANAGMPLLERAGATPTQVVLPGEGHVPIGTAYLGLIAKWLKNIDSEESRTSSFAAISWRSGELNGPQANTSDGILDLIVHQEFVAQAEPGKPLLLFCRSTQHGPGNTLTRPATDTAAIEETLFSYPSANEVPSISNRFDCINVDISSLEARSHPLVNQENAPVVILVSKDRKTSIVMRGVTKLRENDVAAAMRKLLDPSEISAIDARIAVIAPNLRELRTLNQQSRSKVEALAKLRMAPAREAENRKAKAEKIDRAEQELAVLDERIKSLVSKLAPGGMEQAASR